MTGSKLKADSLCDPSKVLVVSATTKKYKDTLLYQSLVDQSYAGSFTFIENNKRGLCEVYNEFITDEHDCVIFIHDDVYVDSCNFVNKVYKSFSKFDVCGLAGGSGIKLKKPLLWHLMSDKQTQSGIVSHKYKDNYITTTFGEIGKNVVLLDGLFLAVQPKKLIEKKVKFDENIKGFHHYDLKFCVDCFRAGLTLGTVPVHVIHASPGLTGFTDEYNVSEEYFYSELKKLYGKKR